jgi:hypothetical protein
MVARSAAPATRAPQQPQIKRAIYFPKAKLETSETRPKNHVNPAVD